MCAIFGLIDYSQHFNHRQRKKILDTLAVESEVRGTDATGFAYNYRKQLYISKSGIRASKFRWKLPCGVNIVMGHTRATTQGTAILNRNNHPFAGNVSNKCFALAHNGVICNEEDLVRKFRLPITNIETDSYKAVQVIEALGELNYDSMAVMAEALAGSFTITILDDSNNFYFIKGDNPLELYHFEEEGYYIYASTHSIITTALQKLNLISHKHTRIPIEEGDILCITPDGQYTCSQFVPNLCNFSGYYWDYTLEGMYQDLVDLCYLRNIEPDYIDLLLDAGYDEEMILAILNDPLITNNNIQQYFYI